MKAILHRKDYTDKQVTGEFTLYDEAGTVLFRCFTLELAWRNNARRISCIPTGTYRAVWRTSEKFAESYHIQELDAPQVTGRTWILIHRGNFHSEIQGCILVGEGFADMNGDGYKDLTRSRQAMQGLMNQVGRNSFILEIQGTQPDFAFVKPASDQPTIPVSQITAGIMATVAAQSLRLRTSPEINNSNIRTSLPDGTVLSVLEEAGDWVRVRTADGLEGFVSRQFLRPADPSEAAAEPDVAVETTDSDDASNVNAGQPHPTEWAVVTASRLRLRSEPRIAAGNILALFPLGTEVGVLENLGDWIRVRTPNGQEGFMFAQYLRLNSQASTEG